MDGNGRWAKRRFLPRSAGHKAGMDRMIELASHAMAAGIKYLTVYALSTENLSRPQGELEGLFGLIRKYFSTNIKKLYKKRAAVRVIGDRTALPQDVAELLDEGEKNSPKDAEFTMVFAINYGARSEMVAACNRAVENGEKVDAKSFSSLLYTGDLPDPDLIIRTGGEMRLSNFLLFQAAYAELYFTNVLFPDFDNGEFDKAINDFASRERRFGKVKN